MCSFKAAGRRPHVPEQFNVTRKPSLCSQAFGVVSNHRSLHSGEHAELEPMPSNPYQGGLPNGPEGTFNFPDGSRYTGAMLGGRVTGHGRYENAMGEVAEGEFRNGVLHGHGKFVDMLGNSWEGTWIGVWLLSPLAQL